MGFDRGQLGNADGVLSFVLSGSGNWEEREDDDLLGALHSELEATLKRKLPRKPCWHQIIRERRATFSVTPSAPLTRKPPCPDSGWSLDFLLPDYPALSRRGGTQWCYCRQGNFSRLKQAPRETVR